MKIIPQSYLRASATWMHIAGIPGFFLNFVITYRSAWMSDWIAPTGEWLTLNILMLSSILLACMLLLRGGLWLLQKKVRLSVGQYAGWCVLEWLFCAFFMALYLTLMNGDAGYFAYVGRAMALIGTTAIYPYVVINLALAYTTLRDTGETAANLLRFYDSTQRLKLVIAADAVLCVRADENYVNIQYMEGSHIRTFSLHSSMSALEELLQSHGILRCHRSYYVNPAHIRILRKEKENTLVAELNQEVQPVPVSSKYYSTLISKL